MNQLPTKRQPGEPEISSIPTWRELADRFRDLMSDFLKEGKELERELEPKLVPALKRLRLEIEKIIAKLEERTKAGQQPLLASRHLGDHLGHVVDVALRVGAARHREAYELERRQRFAAVGLGAAEHDGADLDAAYGARAIQLHGERLRGVLGWWDVRQ